MCGNKKRCKYKGEKFQLGAMQCNFARLASLWDGKNYGIA